MATSNIPRKNGTGVSAAADFRNSNVPFHQLLQVGYGSVIRAYLHECCLCMSLRKENTLRFVPIGPHFLETDLVAIGEGGVNY